MAHNGRLDHNGPVATGAAGFGRVVAVLPAAGGAFVVVVVGCPISTGGSGLGDRVAVCAGATRADDADADVGGAGEAGEVGGAGGTGVVVTEYAVPFQLKRALPPTGTGLGNPRA